mmetsp:Transcript_20914/g.57554  ORF Transcript_20914/g.57554 Transcript_20914/m.57554 type:complete len:138 (+) Transcript_20914:43-456(+)
MQGGIVRKEEELLRASKELLSRDSLSEISLRASRPKEKLDFEASLASVARLSSSSLLVAAEEGHSFEGLNPPGDSNSEDAISVESDDSQHESKDVGGYVEVTKMSAGSRKAAAPHIHNIFDQASAVCYRDTMTFDSL